MTEAALFEPSSTAKQPELSNRRLALSAAVMTATNIARIGIQFAMLPIMARLLGTGSYGLYALAMPTVTFMMMLADGGLGNTLARESPEARAVWSSAFWAIHGFALLLACIVIGWSFLLAYITNQPELPALMAALSVALLFLASCVLPMARLLRQGRLHVGPTVDLVAIILGAGCGILLAAHGAGTWALVGQYLASSVIRAGAINVIAFEVPDFILDFSLLRPHLLLGGSIVGTKIADYAGRIAENTLITSILSASTLGIYGFANQIPRFLCEGVSNPLWAILYVQAIQRPQDVVIRTYYGFIRALGIILFPVTLLAAVGSSQIVGLLLGPAWQGVALPMSILLATTPFQVFGGLTGALLYAAGHGRMQFWISTSLIIGRVAAVLTAGMFGLGSVAAVIGVVTIAFCLIAVVTPARVVNISPAVLCRLLFVPFGCAITASAMCEMIIRILGSQIFMLILAELVSLLLYIGLLIIMERRRLIEDIEMLRALIRKQPAT